MSTEENILIGEFVGNHGFYWPLGEPDTYDYSQRKNTRSTFFYEIPRIKSLSLFDVDLSSLEYEVDGDFLNIRYLHSQGNSYSSKDIQRSTFQDLQRPGGGSEKAYDANKFINEWLLAGTLNALIGAKRDIDISNGGDIFTQILSGLYHQSFKKGKEPIATENKTGGLSWHLKSDEEWSYENINIHLLKWLTGEAWRRNMLHPSKTEEIKNAMPYNKIRVHKDTTHMNVIGNYYDYSSGTDQPKVVREHEYGIRTEEMFKGEIVFRGRGDYSYELLQYIEGDWDYHSFAERLVRDWDAFFDPTSEYFAFDRANLWRIVAENPYLTGKKQIYIDGQEVLLRVDHIKDGNQYILLANDKPEKSSIGSNFWDSRGVESNKVIFNGVSLNERFFNDLTSSSSDSDDNIVGSESDDFIELKGGYVDVFYAEHGNDVVFGNGGQDLIYGNQGSDIIYGNQDHDVIYGGKNSDRIHGNLDDDILFGNLGNDYIYGGDNDDKLYGGKGNDLLDGGNGDDLLWGNKGADTFVCTKGFDVIKDFWALDGDKISVSSVSSAVISEKDGSTLITSGDGQLLLEGFARQFFDESQYLV